VIYLNVRHIRETTAHEELLDDIDSPYLRMYLTLCKEKEKGKVKPFRHLLQTAIYINYLITLIAVSFIKNNNFIYFQNRSSSMRSKDEIIGFVAVDLVDFVDGSAATTAAVMVIMVVLVPWWFFWFFCSSWSF